MQLPEPVQAIALDSPFYVQTDRFFDSTNYYDRQGKSDWREENQDPRITGQAREVAAQGQNY
jgi:thymidylate kinase